MKHASLTSLLEGTLHVPCRGGPQFFFTHVGYLGWLRAASQGSFGWIPLAVFVPLDTILGGGGGWVGGSQCGWVVLSGFPPILGKVQVPLQGGVRFFGWVGGWVAELGRPPTLFMGRGTLFMRLLVAGFVWG